MSTFDGQMENHIISKHTVPAIENKIRVSDYLINVFEQLPSRKSVKKSLKRKEILHNGSIALSGTYVKTGDQFELLESLRPVPKVFPLDLKVHYEDEYLAVIYKPAGYPVSGNVYKSIYNALTYNLNKSSQRDALDWPQPIHRLDAQTSGLLVITKTISVRIKLGEMLAKKEIAKLYHAIVQGRIQTKGELNSSIEGKKCLSKINTLKIEKSKYNGHLTLMELSPVTGRTHQLRIHLSRLGYPIAGDKLYGKKGNTIQHKGLFLSAVQLTFKHPINGEEITIRTDTPQKFTSYMLRESSNAKNLGSKN